MKTIELILFSSVQVEVTDEEYGKIYSGMNPREIFGNDLDEAMLENMQVTDVEEDD